MFEFKGYGKLFYRHPVCAIVKGCNGTGSGRDNDRGFVVKPGYGVVDFIV